MYWRDVVILCAVVTDTDADGYPAEVVKETRVFADVQSVKRTEFYAAKQIGIDLAITVKVRYGDYGNQERLLFSGKEYKVAIVQQLDHASLDEIRVAIEAELEAKAREGEADSKENERLRTLLGLRQKRREFDFESATVTARGSSNWASTLTLSKGAEQGVQAGNCVVDEAGNLVGIIEEAGANWSTMITITDATLEMGALIARTDSTAVLEGDFTLMAEGKLKLTYLPENTELITGDLVLTSSMGGNYPSGLVAGTIESIHTDASGMSRYAVIVPAADLDDLVQVFIIKAFDIVE